MSDLKNLRVQAQRLKDDGARYVPIDPASVLGLLDQLEAAQKDAARYQFLSLNAVKIEAPFLTNRNTSKAYIGDHFEWEDGDGDLDAAIDKAIASQ